MRFKGNMAVLAYKQHDVYIDIKTTKNFQYKRVSNRKKIQNGLDFDTASIVK